MVPSRFRDDAQDGTGARLGGQPSGYGVVEGLLLRLALMPCARVPDTNRHRALQLV